MKPKIFQTGLVCLSSAFLGFLALSFQTANGQSIYLPNDGFEVPNLGTDHASSFKYFNELPPDQLSAATWIFTGSAGIAANGSYFNLVKAPNQNSDGTKSDSGQAAFIQKTGSISQKVTIPFNGTALISFKLEKRSLQGSAEPIEVSLDGVSLGTYTPELDDQFSDFHASGAVTPGPHTLTFSGSVSTSDAATFIDDVTITPSGANSSSADSSESEAAHAPEIIPAPDGLSLPPQSITVELLNMLRGQWIFRNEIGQLLEFKGPVEARAFTQGATGNIDLAYLNYDPEFPGEIAHAVLKRYNSQADHGSKDFKIDEPFFKCHLSIKPSELGVISCKLTHILLGPAQTGEGFVGQIYVIVGDKYFPIWLVPSDHKKGAILKLVTSQVGNVFNDGDQVEVELQALDRASHQERKIKVRAVNYAKGDEVWTQDLTISSENGKLSENKFVVPLHDFGVFKITASDGVTSSELRICRIPSPRKDVDPVNATVGMNIFQQQIWWYAYQAPLFEKAGVHWIRPWLNTENAWSTVEPTSGQWDTRALDSALRRMKSLNQQYECILFKLPDWVKSESGRIPSANKTDWDDYVTHLVGNYKGQIQHFEIWNEPDDPRYQKSDSSEQVNITGEQWYTDLLSETSAVARKANPDVILDGLSHAGFQGWLRTITDHDVTPYMDVVTLHSYTPLSGFMKELRQRKAILQSGGFKDQPIWVNEFGSPAYDFSAAYSQKFNCSEKKQATDLMIKYAEALSLSPKTKAFWFCSHDPRDSAHADQWTGDSANGVLYQGFLPKLSYAALAGVAFELDGKDPVGQTELQGIHQISFSGLTAVVWSDFLANTKPIPATALGCLDDEKIVVRDMYANQTAAGIAKDITLDLSAGPLYLEGSAQLGTLSLAANEQLVKREYAESTVKLRHDQLALAPGSSGTAELSLPEKATATIETESPMAVSVQLVRKDNVVSIIVTAKNDASRSSGSLTLAIATPGGETLHRTVSVSIGASDLLQNGSFYTDNMGDWIMERTNCFGWEGADGHNGIGALKLTPPFDGRIRQNLTDLKTDKPLNFSCWAKGSPFSGTLSMVLACFGKDGEWIKDVVLATNDPATSPSNSKIASISLQADKWVSIKTQLLPQDLPTKAGVVVFYLDIKGDGHDPILIDDIDLWQP